MANNIVADAFIELRAQTKEFDKALNDISKKLKKGIDLNIGTKVSEKQVKALEESLKLKPLNLESAGKTFGTSTSKAIEDQSRSVGRSIGAEVIGEIAGNSIIGRGIANQVSKGFKNLPANSLQPLTSSRTASPQLDKVAKLSELGEFTNIDFDSSTKVFKLLDSQLAAGKLSLEQYEQKFANFKAFIGQNNKALANEFKFLGKNLSLASNSSKLAKLDSPGWKDFGRSIKGAGSSLTGFVAKATPVIAVTAGITAGLVKSAQAASKYADTIDNLSKQYSLSLITTQSLKQLTEEAGLSFDTFGGIVTKLRTTQAEAIAGNKTFAESYKAIGLSIEDIATLSPEELLETVSTKLAAGASNAAVYAAGTKLLGEQFGRLQPILNQIGTKGLYGVNQELAKYNDTVDEIVGRDVAGQYWERIGRSFKKFGRDLGGGVLISLPGDYGAALQDALDKRQAQLEIEQEITNQQIEQAGILRNKDSQKQLETERNRLADIKQGNAFYFQQQSILKKTYDRELLLYSLRSSSLGKAVQNLTNGQKYLKTLESQETALIRVNEYYSKQLDIVNRIKGTLTTVAGSALIDAFQQTAVNPSVSSGEFTAAGGPGLNNSRGIEQVVRGSERAIIAAGYQIEKVSTAINLLTEQVEKLKDKLGEPPSPIY